MKEVLKMAEINKLLLEKEKSSAQKINEAMNNEDAAKELEDMWAGIERTRSKTILADFKKTIESMTPPEQTILLWVHKSLEKLRKSQDLSSKKLIRLNWGLIVLTTIGIILMLLVYLRGRS